MKPRTMLVLVLALVCGGSAAVGVSQMGAQRRASADRETTPVLVAKADIARGSVLKEEDLDLRQWPTALAPAGAVGSLDQAVDRVNLVPLAEGEAVLASKLAAEDSGIGLAAMIPHGMRAFTIDTPHVAAGVGGFLMPGDKVDVLLTTRSRGQHDTTGGGTTTTLLQNLQVLAADKYLDASEANSSEARQLRSVTLLVTPDQAAKLDLGMNRGELHLALRNPADNDEAKTQPATMAQLQFYQERPGTPQPTTDNESGEVVAAVAQVPVEPEPSADQPAPDYGFIRTLRGSNRGDIRVQRAY